MDVVIVYAGSNSTSNNMESILLTAYHMSIGGLIVFVLWLTHNRAKDHVHRNAMKAKENQCTRLQTELHAVRKDLLETSLRELKLTKVIKDYHTEYRRMSAALDVLGEKIDGIE
jgi:hypothetical protein